MPPEPRDDRLAERAVGRRAIASRIFDAPLLRAWLQSVCVVQHARLGQLLVIVALAAGSALRRQPPTSKRGEVHCRGRRSAGGGLTTKIRPVTDARGLPIRFALTPKQLMTSRTAAELLGHRTQGATCSPTRHMTRAGSGIISSDKASPCSTASVIASSGTSIGARRNVTRFNKDVARRYSNLATRY